MLLRSADRNPTRLGRYVRIALVLLGVPAFLVVAYVLEGLNNPSLFSRNYILAEYGQIIMRPGLRRPKPQEGVNNAGT